MNRQRLSWSQANQHSKMASGLISQILRELQNQCKIALKKSRRAVSAKNQRVGSKGLRLRLTHSWGISLSIRPRRINRLFRFFLKVRSKISACSWKTSFSRSTPNSTKLEFQATKISLVKIQWPANLSSAQRQIHLHFNNSKSQPVKCLTRLSSSL